MDDGIDRVLVDRRCDEVHVAHIADHEWQLADGLPMAVTQVVEDDRVVTCLGQMASGKGADVAGAPGDQDAHRECQARAG